MKSKLKVLILILCSVLLGVGSVVGTQAYLISNSGKIMDLKTALHYLKGDKSTGITDKVSAITFGLNEDYAHIVAAYEGTAVEAEQDQPVYAYYVPNGSNYDVYVLADDQVHTPANSSNLFANMTQLTSFDGANLDTGGTKDMSFLFFECTKLSVLDVTGWDTSNVTTMANMFGGDSLLTAITGLDTWKLSNVTDAANMFSDCASLQKLDNIGTWDTGNVTAMECMFYHCVNLTDVDVSDWDVSNVWNMWGMFCGCKSLTNIHVDRWNTEKVTNTAEMFEGCTALTAITIPEGMKTVGAWAFANCGSLTTVTFLGDAPMLHADCFTDGTAKAFYLNTYESWTESVRQNYGGSITWQSHVIEEFTYNGDATCTEDGTKTGVCRDCGEVFVKAAPGTAVGHTFGGNQFCTLCGAEDPDYVPPIVPTLSPSFPTLTFEDVITMNVYFRISDLTDVAEMGMITYSSSVADYSVETAENVIPGYRFSEGYQMYVVSTDGIAAKDMSDVIWFSVYAKLTDGSYTYSRLLSYSPTTYAYDQLKGNDEDLKKLMVALLNYGAEAQIFFDYRTDALMNASLSEQQQETIESYRADMMNTVSIPDADKASNFTRTAKGFTRRYPSISFEGAFKINYYCVPSAAADGEITLYYWDQTAYDAAEVLTAENATAAIVMTNDGTGTYKATVSGIAAKDLDQGVYVSFVYSDGTTSYASGVLGYSIGTYCNTQSASGSAAAALAEATAVYGYYARQYFYATT